jgi:hypothetical protein
VKGKPPNGCPRKRCTIAPVRSRPAGTQAAGSPAEKVVRDQHHLWLLRAVLTFGCTPSNNDTRLITGAWILQRLGDAAMFFIADEMRSGFGRRATSATEVSSLALSSTRLRDTTPEYAAGHGTGQAAPWARASMENKINRGARKWPGVYCVRYREQGLHPILPPLAVGVAVAMLARYVWIAGHNACVFPIARA